MVKHKLRAQDLVFLASVGTSTAAIAALLARRRRLALALGLGTVAATLAAKRVSRSTPAPMPYSLRWTLPLVHPFFPPSLLAEMLEVSRGDRVLEVGPGLGHHAIAMATLVGDDGAVEVVDLQRPMIEATESRAAQRGLANVHGQLADARRLPFADQSFDGAYLVTVLGEIPDRARAWDELRRVLKPASRLVVGEMVLDPDSINRSTLRREGEAASFRHVSATGPGLTYLAAFTTAGPGSTSHSSAASTSSISR